MFQSLLYHFQISSYQRKSISSHSICTISCSKLFLFKSVMYQFLKTTVCNILMKKGSVFQNIGQNNLCLFLPLFDQRYLFSFTCKKLLVIRSSTRIRCFFNATFGPCLHICMSVRELTWQQYLSLKSQIKLMMRLLIVQAIAIPCLFVFYYCDKYNSLLSFLSFMSNVILCNREKGMCISNTATFYF